MTDIIETPTADEIARHYSSAMDSVNLINGTKPENETDAEWANCLKRNKEHLEIMVAKTYWTTQDLTPFHSAIAKVA
jgi:hypothetical protein